MESLLFFINSSMEKFDQAVEEGILSRAGEKVKNIGRTIKHPFARAFGNDDDQLDAVTTTNRGYKKRKMLNSILQDAANDLIKLGVLKSDTSPQEVAAYLAISLDQHELLDWDENRDNTKLGRQKSTYAGHYEDPESDAPEDEDLGIQAFNLKDNVKVTTRRGKTFNGTVVRINDDGSYTVRQPNGAQFAYKEDQLQKI